MQAYLVACWTGFGRAASAQWPLGHAAGHAATSPMKRFARSVMCWAACLAAASQRKLAVQPREGLRAAVVGPFTAFFVYDWLIDKISVLWRLGSMPVLPCVLFTISFSTYLAAAFTYPFAHSVREMVDFWPKKDGLDPFKGNYRKASTFVWFHQNILGFYPGFFKNYFWHIAPQYAILYLDGL